MKNKYVIITGANGNLGTAVVQKFLAEGYFVVAVDGSSSNLGFAMGNAKFEFNIVNLTDETETTAFVHDVVNRHGTIDAVLMLVGGFTAGSIEDTGAQELKKMYTLNFETAYFVARPALQYMRRAGYGRLVFIGSRPALKADQGKELIAYALTKSMLVTLVDFINAETAGTNVTASVVIPSTIDTAVNRVSMPGANPADWVKPQQVADVLEFICGEKGMPIRESIYKVYSNA
jgi:NAD(P)-dependent dehydrogenase (short-subunit alcohol dehydrogenase family)